MSIENKFFTAYRIKMVKGLNSINSINSTNLCPGVNRETLRKDLNDLIVKRIILRKGQKGVYITNLHNCQLYANFAKSLGHWTLFRTSDIEPKK